MTLDFEADPQFFAPRGGGESSEPCLAHAEPSPCLHRGDNTGSNSQMPPKRLPAPCLHSSAQPTDPSGDGGFWENVSTCLFLPRVHRFGPTRPTAVSADPRLGRVCPRTGKQKAPRLPRIPPALYLLHWHQGETSYRFHGTQDKVKS